MLPQTGHNADIARPTRLTQRRRSIWSALGGGHVPVAFHKPIEGRTDPTNCDAYCSYKFDRSYLSPVGPEVALSDAPNWCQMKLCIQPLISVL
jgi:hypothetical protein